MTDVPRRAFLIGGSAFLLVACAPAGPGAVTIVAQGTAGMNPGPDGADRPLTLQVLQLRGSGAFDGADFFGLQTASATLGGDLVKADTITLTTGANGNIGSTLAARQPRRSRSRRPQPSSPSSQASATRRESSSAPSLRSRRRTR